LRYGALLEHAALAALLRHPLVTQPTLRAMLSSDAPAMISRGDEAGAQRAAARAAGAELGGPQTGSQRALVEPRLMMSVTAYGPDAAAVSVACDVNAGKIAPLLMRVRPSQLSTLETRWRGEEMTRR
jgi:hypothetical protein